MHLVWNRIENATKYEVRYKMLPGGTWKSKLAFESYKAFKIPPGTTDYLFQVRAFCNNTWTDWGNGEVYNAARVYRGYNVSILADRAVDEHVMRLYWLKTADIDNIEVRYRRAGTTPWKTKINNNGFLRLRDLSPATFYEYSYRPKIGGYWGDWYPTYLHFLTPSSGAANKTSNSTQALVHTPSPVEDKTVAQLTVFPNPATAKVIIRGQIPLYATYAIRDVNGATVKVGTVINSTIDLSGIRSGLLLLTIEKGAFSKTVALIKQ